MSDSDSDPELSNEEEEEEVAKKSSVSAAKKKKKKKKRKKKKKKKKKRRRRPPSFTYSDSDSDSENERRARDMRKLKARKKKEPTNWDAFEEKLQRKDKSVEVDFRSMMKKRTPRAGEDQEDDREEDENVPEWARGSKVRNFDHLENKETKSSEDTPAWSGLLKKSARGPEDKKPETEEEVPEFMKMGLKKSARGFEQLESPRAKDEPQTPSWGAGLKKVGQPQVGSPRKEEEPVPEWAKKARSVNVEDLERKIGSGADSNEVDFRANLKQGGTSARQAKPKGPPKPEDIKKELALLKSRWVSEAKARQTVEKNVETVEALLQGLRQYLTESKQLSDQLLERIETLTSLAAEVKPSSTAPAKKEVSSNPDANKKEIEELKARISALDQEKKQINTDYKSLKKQYRKASRAARAQ